MFNLILSSVCAATVIFTFQDSMAIAALNGFFCVGNFGMFVLDALKNHKNELLDKLKEK